MSDYKPIYVLISSRRSVIDYNYGDSLSSILDQWQKEWESFMNDYPSEEFFILKATIDNEAIAGFHKDSAFYLKEE